MKKKTDILFELKTLNDSEGKAFLRKIGRGDIADTLPHTEEFFLTFMGDDPDIGLLIKLLKERGLKDDGRDIRVRIYRKWTKEELFSYELLSMYTSAEGKSEERHDLSTGCPKCGCGAKQNTDLYVQGSYFKKKKMAATFSDLIVVSDELVEIFEKYKLTGYELGVVRDLKTKEIIPNLKQLIITHSLPPLSPNTKRVYDERLGGPCPVCGRGGHFGSPTGKEEYDSRYKEEDLEKTGYKDFNLTYECYGCGLYLLVSPLNENVPAEERFVSRPLWVVTSRACRAIKEAKINYIYFEPVIIEK